jgi:carboxymethylenebutenolidase
MISSVFAALVLSKPSVKSCCDPMAVFLKDPAFAAAHASPLPLRFAAAGGKTVHFKAADGTEASGYWVAPSTPNAPAIVMIHEWWGLNPYIKREAEQLHNKLGYAVLAVDLYDGKIASTAQEAGQYMKGVDSNHLTSILSSAMAGLKKGSFGHKFNRVGTIGWCFGGGWSHRAAIAGGSLVKACVMFYGMPDTDAADLKRLKAPVLMVWAKKDQWINADVVDGFKTAMSSSGKSLRVLPYEAGHGFANPSNPVYDKTARDAAFSETYAFFRKHLG